MSDFEPEYQLSLIRAARFTLQDGRSFVLEAEQTAEGSITLTPIAGQPVPHRDDVCQLAQVVYYDECGRICSTLKRAAQPLDA